MVRRRPSQAQAGDILVLHDGLRGTSREVRESTVRWLPTLLESLTARGLQPVTVSQLMAG